jgi:5-formyltetrahydrofolate cyclo-ligase
MPVTDVAQREELRTRLLAVRDDIAPLERLSRAEAISTHLDTLPAFVEAGSIAFSYSTGSEVPTLELIMRVVESEGRRAFLPFELNGRLELAEWRPSDPVIQGEDLAFQPRFRRAVPMEEVDVIVVPGLAFDLRGRRLGSGRGLYHGLLARLPEGTARIGIAFAEHLVEELPVDGHEPAVQFVVTDMGLTDCRTAR